MLVSMHEILNKANREGYAVIAPNVFNLETIRAAVEAAMEERSPIILDYGEGVERYTDIYEFGYLTQFVAAKYPIPVAVNYDHGTTFEACIKAIRANFTSIMIDRSTKSFEENVKETREIVRIAHAAGISVEAELGHVGIGSNYEEEGQKNFTDPDIAAEYVKATEIDALAVAIGTAHGLYTGIPKIDFTRLEEIKRKTAIPLVMHGGSFTGDDQLSKACRMGINKINIGTELDVDAIDAMMSDSKNIVKGWELPQRLMFAKESFKNKVRHYIKVFGSNNKV